MLAEHMGSLAKRSKGNKEKLHISGWKQQRWTMGRTGKPRAKESLKQSFNPSAGVWTTLKRKGS
jgi:hypothetical protein